MRKWPSNLPTYLSIYLGSDSCDSCDISNISDISDSGDSSDNSSVLSFLQKYTFFFYQKLFIYIFFLFFKNFLSNLKRQIIDKLKTKIVKRRENVAYRRHQLSRRMQ